MVEGVEETQLSSSAGTYPLGPRSGIFHVCEERGLGIRAALVLGASARQTERISPDRWFLDRIATHMLAFEGDSHVEWFEGNYEGNFR